MLRTIFKGLLNSALLLWAGIAMAQYPIGTPGMPVGAQPAPWGRCDDMVRMQSFAIDQNLYAYQLGFPGNNGIAARDPSGQTFLRMPAANPTIDAFFVAWNLDLIQISAYLPGPQVIGRCAFASMPSRPVAPTFNANMAATQGVIYQPNPTGLIAVPVGVANNSLGFSPPGIATPADAQRCMSTTQNREQFVACMIPQMLSPTQKDAYACAMQNRGNNLLLSTCLANTVLGGNERKALQQATACYQQYGGDVSKYPLCMATQNFDPKTAATIDCVSQHSKTGQLSAWTAAGCAAGTQFNMNAEATVAVQCAMSTGGEPQAFAACTAGQLTMNELDKCFTVGVGGNGCFGDNNTIVQGLRSLGVSVQNVLGPNSFPVQAWNNMVGDIKNGPGANNEIVKAVRTINHDLTHGLGKNNDLRKVASRLGLGGLF
ncbi:hypothetical protein PCA31118_03044 [Pandoraea captiosa]|uniref:Conjugal transfer protein TraN n=2 Tax=Pandoraea captiosa TaxID=2508302 RepID=A0A5E5A8H8_9BURK|nr:hypothetical protein PCA31118_03044 [Pandoraea captiosa]